MRGLVSITFRPCSPQEIISLCLENGLTGIEWGGDVHVPCDDIDNAEKVGNLTKSAGLTTVCYGSYYRAGGGTDGFLPVLETAKDLKAPLIRIWAGTKSDGADGYFERVANDISYAVSKAGNYGIKISLECHRGTLTEKPESALKLSRECGCRLHFQPNPDITREDNDAYLRSILPYLSVFHVFAWDKGDVRLPLSSQADMWRYYHSLSPKTPMLIEFVKDNLHGNLSSDAEVLSFADGI